MMWGDDVEGWSLEPRDGVREELGRKRIVAPSTAATPAACWPTDTFGHPCRLLLSHPDLASTFMPLASPISSCFQPAPKTDLDLHRIKSLPPSQRLTGAKQSTSFFFHLLSSLLSSTSFFFHLLSSSFIFFHLLSSSSTPPPHLASLHNPPLSRPSSCNPILCSDWPSSSASSMPHQHTKQEPTTQ